jgi:hypothetical protein
MKRLPMFASVFFALLSPAAWAQNSPETWQGTLHSGQDRRLVLQVTKSDGALKGRIFSIDQRRVPHSRAAVPRVSGIRIRKTRRRHFQRPNLSFARSCTPTRSRYSPRAGTSIS